MKGVVNMNSPYNGKFQVTQEFKGADHDGLDLVGLDSKEIHSTVNGEVVYAAWENSKNHNQGFGQYVVVKNGKRYYHFGHLSKILATLGQKVKTGDVIGIEGDTGYSFGSHCHYCVRTSMARGTYLDVCEISGIPNKLGIYNDGAAASKETTTETPKETTSEKKEITDKLIDAVIAGDYGNGAVRKKKLEKEGYVYADVQAAVEKKLKSDKTESKDEKPKQEMPDPKTTETFSPNHDAAMKFDDNLTGAYAVIPLGGLNVRKGAGINKERITTLPFNTIVQCYGYYTEVGGIKWYLIKTANTEGFVSSQYLARR